MSNDANALRSKLLPAKVETPRADRIEATRVLLAQPRSPAYGEALRLCRKLESESATVADSLTQANARIAKLEAVLKESVTWMEECVNDVLYPLSHQEDEMGATAAGLGGSTVALFAQAKSALAL